MEYRNFTLHIGARQGRRCRVRVDSPAGESQGILDLSGMDGTLHELVDEVDSNTFRRRILIPATDASRTSVATETLSRFGDVLFRALFHDQVLSLLDRSLGMTEGKGLRIVLWVDATDPLLNSLPWEFLYRDEKWKRGFLGCSRLSPIVRRVVAHEPCRELLPRGVLRILVIPSSPAGGAPLDTGEEIRGIREAWADRGGAEVHVLERADVGALRQCLLERTFHVLHFAGHGDFRDGQGVLFFGTDRPDPVEGELLADHVKDFKSLRLVFLNACNTAKNVDQDHYDPFGGVATALALGGVPAVVAMQFPISDRAAVGFSGTFYRRLAAGDPIDAAVTEGRLAIRAAERQSLEWGTPVVFLREPAARLWQPSAPAAASTRLDQHWPWNRLPSGD